MQYTFISVAMIILLVPNPDSSRWNYKFYMAKYCIFLEIFLGANSMPWNCSIWELIFYLNLNFGYIDLVWSGQSKIFPGWVSVIKLISFNALINHTAHDGLCCMKCSQFCAHFMLLVKSFVKNATKILN